jgi:hypothetical protein
MWTEENQVIDSLNMFLRRLNYNIFCLDASRAPSSSYAITTYDGNKEDLNREIFSCSQNKKKKKSSSVI